MWGVLAHGVNAVHAVNANKRFFYIKNYPTETELAKK